MTKFASILSSMALAFAGSIALAENHTHEDHEAAGEPAAGSEDQGGMGGMMGDMGAMMENMPEHMQGMMGAMQTMMQGMPMESAGDPDADFLLMMIPHHQSAVDMARVELEQGDDEETRAMAEKVIEAQEAEIAEMRAMLERMGIEAPAAPAQ
jgi:uncharacterized protein (DUF305 family)